MSYKHIAVAVDFSQKSLKAFDRALTVAKNHNAHLSIINVLDTSSFGSIASYDLKYAAELKEKRLQQLNDLLTAAKDADIGSVDTELLEGPAKKILTSLPNIDLIICGQTGVNEVEKFILGSVAEKITQFAPYDVLIVK